MLPRLLLFAIVVTSAAKAAPVAEHRSAVRIETNVRWTKKGEEFDLVLKFSNQSKTKVRLCLLDNLMPILVSRRGEVLVGGINRDFTRAPIEKDFPTLKIGQSYELRIPGRVWHDEDRTKILVID